MTGFATGQGLTSVNRLPTAVRHTYLAAAFEQRATLLASQAGLARTGLDGNVLREALAGYYNLRMSKSAKHPGPRPAVLTIVDLARSSSQKRLWVVDVAHNKLLFHTLVAHGKGTGDDLARAFSNTDGSEQSSLGFYRTGYDTYQGKHGLSLKIKGMDPGFNTNAEKRSVVVHGADYVCEEFVRKHGRLGRSQGCPALPVAETAAIVQAIKGGSVLYVHGPASAGYRSKWLDLDSALEGFSSEARGLPGVGNNTSRARP